MAREMRARVGYFEFSNALADSIFRVLSVSRASSGDGYAKLESDVWVGFNLRWQISIAWFDKRLSDPNPKSYSHA